jgi:hypothetical protein
MYDKELVLEIISQILNAISRIERRVSKINNPNNLFQATKGQICLIPSQ